MDIAARLGADVAFLASPSELALAWGRGERMLDLPPLPPAALLLVLPDFGVETGRAYADLAARRAEHGGSAGASWRSPRTLGGWSAVASDAVNDFEGVIFERYPALATVRAQLAALPQTVFARMSGSGSTLFAIQEPTEAASSVPSAGEGGLLALPAGWRVIFTRTGSQSSVELF